MKKTIFTTILTFTFITIFAQNPTTSTDYNYLTRGLKVQLDNGLELKKGYDIEKIGEYSDNDTKCTIWHYGEKNKEKANAILVILQRTNDVLYLCLPNTNSKSEIIQQCYNDLINLEKSEITLVIFALLSVQEAV